MDLYPSGSVSGGRLVLDDYSFPIPDRIFPLVRDGQQVIPGTRREDVKVSADAMSVDGMQFRAEIEAIEPDLVHHVQIVYVRMGKIAFSGLCPQDVKLHLGQLVNVVIHPERLYFFDTVSGKRL